MAVGITPKDFWDMSMREFILVSEGYKKKHDIAMDALAWHAAVVVSPHTKKRVDPQKLRGKKKDSDDVRMMFKNADEMREYYRRRRASKEGE